MKTEHTQRMLENAKLATEDGEHVAVIAHTAAYAGDLKRRFRDMGGDDTRVAWLPIQNAGQRLRGTNARVFIDNSVRQSAFTVADLEDLRRHEWRREQRKARTRLARSEEP